MFAPLPWSNHKVPTVQFCSINDSVGKHSSKNKGATRTVGTCSSRPAGSVSAFVGFWCPKSKCARTQHAYGMITVLVWRVFINALCVRPCCWNASKMTYARKKGSPCLNGLPRDGAWNNSDSGMRIRDELRRIHSLSLFCCWQILNPWATLNTCWGHCWYWCWCWHWCYSWQPVGQKCCKA